MKNVEIYVGLPSNQEEDLREIFYEFVKVNSMSYQECVDYFKPGTKDFASFLLILEKNTDWFDYRQMEGLFHEMTFYIEEMKDGE